MVRGPFVHYDSGAVGERAVNDVAVPGDPADVGGAPESVVFLEVEDPAVRQGSPNQIAGGRMQYPLGFSGRAAGVEDVKRMLAVERLCGADGGRVGHQLVPPQIAARFHVDLLIAAI